MLKNTTYKDKFAMLDSWVPLIIETVKRDLKSEHLKNDMAFVRHYFPGKNPAKLSGDEMAPAYSHAIATAEKSEELAEFIANRWLLKNGDLYHYFERELSKLNPDFGELETLDKSTATKMMEEAVQQFGPIDTYLFCVLNSVVFPEETFKTLGQRAKSHVVTQKEAEERHHQEASGEALKRNYELHIARLTDKYEKKILGLQKKYIQDVDTLKKQVTALQRKLSGQ